MEIVVAKYCDSSVLEHNWFRWLVTSKTPLLEGYRSKRIIYTKIIGVVQKDGVPITRHNETFQDPMWPVRRHCIINGDELIQFETNDGVPNTDLPEANSLSSYVNPEIHEKLLADGFTLDDPTSDSWHLILRDIKRTCDGIVVKFNMKSEEDSHDLSSEALLQVMNKLINYKLVYIPGKAPVFNLLTTTIYRIMYTAMNRRKAQRNGHADLLVAAAAGILPKNRSLRTNTNHKRTIKT